MKKLWINSKDYILLSDKQPSLTEEIATRKRSIDFYSIGMYLPNPDPVLKKQGKDITIYKELLSDAHVGACVQSRKSGVLSLEWEIDRGKSKSRQARLIEDVLKSLDLHRIISEILNAPLFGYQPLEVLWEKVGNYILPRDIIGKPQEWFVFSEENELRFKTKDNYNGEPLPDKKFLLARHNPTYQNPYGFPELSRCFWPITFKRGGIKFWVIFTEKYGMPFLIGKHPRGTSKQDTDALAEMLESMIQDAIAVIPDDSSVEILTPQGRASADIYSRLLQFCNAEVSKAILGQTLTTELGQVGSYAAAETHMEVRKDIVDADKKLVEQVINQLINWITELNFSPTSSLPAFIMYEEEDVDKTLAERDRILVDAGVRFTKKYFMREYGFDEEDLEIGSPQGGQFAEPSSRFTDQQAVDELIDGLTPEELQKQAETILKPIINLIKEGNSYEEIMEKLAETYPDMDTDALEDMLARAIFVSEIWGRLNAEK